MSIKISELPAGSTLSGTEEIPIVQSATTKKITAQDIADLASGGAVWGGITGDIIDQTDLVTALDLKVDKVPGKGLSANDFTNTLKTKLDGIEDGAEVNVNADWNATSGDAQILNKPTIPSVSGLVPYTGATSDVDLGEFELKAGQVEFDQTPTGTAGVAVMRWNDSLGSSETTLKGGSVVLKNGVDLVARVVNKVTPNATLTKAAYRAVRVSGAQGQRLAVAYAQANNDNNSADTIGLVCENIATNQEGFILTVGQLEGINTTGSLQSETWSDGDVLYLSPTTPGAITNVKPTGATGHIVVIGYVEYAHAINGKIYVKIMNGWELDELHNVAISTPLNNQSLVYESATTLWKNKALTTAEVADSTNKRYVTDANLTVIGNTSGTNTGDQTFITPRVQTISSSATVTAVSTNDIVTITAQSVGLTLANPTGAFVEGQSLIIRIKDNGTAKSIAYGTNFRAIGVTAPSTTTANKTTYIGCIYNSTDTKFDIIGTCTEA